MHQSIEDGTKDGRVFKDGYYYMCFGIGEVIPYVQLTKLYALQDNKYLAYADIYGNFNYCSVQDPHKPIDMWSNKEKSEIEEYGSIVAMFQEIEVDSSKRYVLLKYNEISNNE